MDLNIFVAIVPFVIFVAIVIAIVAVVISGFARVSEDLSNAACPIVTSAAVVVAKRSHIQAVTTKYFVTFEFEDGRRQEVHMDGQSFGLLVEQDQGILKMQGTGYVGFNREGYNQVDEPSA